MAAIERKAEPLNENVYLDLPVKNNSSELINEINHGTREETSQKRKEWSFTLYDFEGRGRVSKHELASLLRALYDVVSRSLRHKKEVKQPQKLKLSVNIESDKENQRIDEKPKGLTVDLPEEPPQKPARSWRRREHKRSRPLVIETPSTSSCESASLPRESNAKTSEALKPTSWLPYKLFRSKTRLRNQQSHDPNILSPETQPLIESTIESTLPCKRKAHRSSSAQCTSLKDNVGNIHQNVKPLRSCLPAEGVKGRVHGERERVRPASLFVPNVQPHHVPHAFVTDTMNTGGSHVNHNERLDRVTEWLLKNGPRLPNEVQSDPERHRRRVASSLQANVSSDQSVRMKRSCMCKKCQPTTKPQLEAINEAVFERYQGPFGCGFMAGEQEEIFPEGIAYRSNQGERNARPFTIVHHFHHHYHHYV